jgi:hypothetical protein
MKGFVLKEADKLIFKTPKTKTWTLNYTLNINIVKLSMRLTFYGVAKSKHKFESRQANGKMV